MDSPPLSTSSAIRSRAVPFLLLGAAHLAALLAQWDAAATLTKILLMPSLAWWIAAGWGLFGRDSLPRASEPTERPHGPHPTSAPRASAAAPWLMAALGLSWGGDVLLLFSSDPGLGGYAFLGGLLLFLAAHAAYITTFLRLRRDAPAPGRSETASRTSLLLGSALYLVLFMRLLWPGLDPMMKIAVPLYAAVILAMAWVATGLRGHVPTAPWRSMVLGALLFVISDSLIALNRFAFDVPYARLAIMSSYIAAQALLATGVARSLR